MYTPTKKMIFEECQRRMITMGMVFDRTNRWKYPSQQWNQEDLTTWLQENCTQTMPESQQLKSRVSELKAAIQRQTTMLRNTVAGVTGLLSNHETNEGDVCGMEEPSKSMSAATEPSLSADEPRANATQALWKASNLNGKNAATLKKSPNDSRQSKESLTQLHQPSPKEGYQTTNLSECEEHYLRQSDADKPNVLISMAIGLNCCKIVLDVILPFGTTKLNKKELVREAQRRYEIERRSEAHDARIFRPVKNWTVNQLMRWLENNPIRGDSNIDFVCHKLNATNFGFGPSQGETALLPPDDYMDSPTLMARALGLPGCDFREAPFTQHERECSPTREMLYAECERRCSVFGIKLRNGNSNSRPNCKSPIDALINWLISNPIKDEHESARLIALVRKLKTSHPGLCRGEEEGSRDWPQGGAPLSKQGQRKQRDGSRARESDAVDGNLELRLGLTDVNQGDKYESNIHCAPSEKMVVQHQRREQELSFLDQEMNTSNLSAEGMVIEQPGLPIPEQQGKDITNGDVVITAMSSAASIQSAAPSPAPAVIVEHLKSPPASPDKENATIGTLDRRVLMTRVLGLPGCCLEKGLLRHQELRGWIPTDEMLLDECTRRLGTRGIVFRKVLIKLLMDNPIQDEQECDRLLLWLLDLETEFRKETVIEQDRSGTKERNLKAAEGDVLIATKMPASDLVEKDHVRWSFDDLCSSSSEPRTGTKARAGGWHQATANGGVHPGQADDDAKLVTMPATGSEPTSSTTGMKATSQSSHNSESMLMSSYAENDHIPLEYTEKPIIDSELEAYLSQASLVGEKKPNNIVMMDGALLTGTQHTSEAIAVGHSQNESENEATRMSDSTLRCKRSQTKTDHLEEVFDIDQVETLRSNKEGVDSMGDISSATSSFQCMSLSSLEGSSNDQKICGSLRTNPSTPSSGGLSSSRGSSESSSQEGSGLSATSKKQARVRGAGPLSPVAEDELANDGSVEGKEVAFREDDMFDAIDGPDTAQDDGTFSMLSGLTGIMMSSIDGDCVRNVTKLKLCDKEGRPGKYTGSVFGFGVVAPVVPHGKGTMLYDSGVMYEGGWKHGNWEDYGKLTFAEHDLYAGEFARGIFWGRGLRRWPDGSHYEGEWVLGKRSGNGSFHSCCGDETEGTWVEDTVEGMGRVTFANGSHYEGMFVGGVQEGECKYRDVYGKEHEGVWVSQKELGDRSRYDGLCGAEGKPHGFGKSLYQNGDVYEGEYHNGVKQGRGRLTYANGSCVEGSFVNDSDAVKGTFVDREGRELDDVKVTDHILPDGSRYGGPWKDGGVNGFGKAFYENGDVYEGEYWYGMKHGRGRMAYADGSQHIGMFADGCPEGDCTFIDADGREYVGVWVCNKRLCDGSTYDGQLKMGRANGYGKRKYRYGATYEGKHYHIASYGVFISLICLELFYKDHLSTTGKKDSEERFAQMDWNMKESGKPTRCTEKEHCIIRLAPNTRENGSMA